MNKLLKLQLKKAYGEKLNLAIKDKEFQRFLQLIEIAYEDYEDEAKLLEKILEENSKELEDINKLLLQKQELLKNVEDSMDDGIFYKDINHRYIGCNKVFREFLKLDEENIIGKTDYDFFDEKLALKYYDTNEEIIKSRKKVSYKQWVEHRGKNIYVLVNKTPLIGSYGDVIGIVGIVRDITHEYELQKSLEHKNIMLIQQNKLVSMGEMIANIAHQWRQPLNTLGLLIQKIGIFYKQDILDEKRLDGYIEDSMVLMEKMSETIDDFRNFFSNKRVFEKFDVKEAIWKSLSIIRPILEQKNIEYSVEIDDSYFVQGYKNEFFQVIVNILNNAIDVLVEDKIFIPKIKINLTKVDENILLEICDNANGISSKNINKIFDPYFTTKENGTGLGLYMSKIIIEDHMDGKIEFVSNSFGTTFSITIRGGVVQSS